MDYGTVLGLVNFNELLEILWSGDYYKVVFPFLLFFAVLYTALSSTKVSLFRNKKTGELRKPVVFIVTLIVSLFGVTFEISDGYVAGDLLMMMFPNISALTIGILALYVVGAIFGKNFFKGLFRKDHAAFTYLAIGGIGLGAVLFYVGIAMGFIEPDVIDQESYWNFILALFFLILGVIFLLTEQYPLAVILITVLGVYLYNFGDAFILEYFIDPIVFIFVIVIALISYVGKDKAKEKEDLERVMKNQENALKDYGDLDDYESRIRDIIDEALKSNKKKYEKKFK